MFIESIFLDNLNDKSETKLSALKTPNCVAFYLNRCTKQKHGVDI